MKTTIGICARNEESSIIQMLDSLTISILKDSNNTEFNILFCANGCSDQTIPLIKNWQAKNNQINSKLFILEEGNLIESQRLIVSESKKLGSENIIFLDADVVVDKNCINELIRNSFNNDTKSVYAVSIPIQRKKQSLIEKTLNLYDTSNNIFSERKHLHGRTFLIKTDTWNIPETLPKLIADDIYLSFYLLQTFGDKSIKKITTAKVYFNQIKTYTDFYNSFKRRSVEINKCFALFPKFKLLPSDQVNRKFLWSKLNQEPLKNILKWLYLIFLRKIAKLQFKVESFFGLEENNQWVITKTSKKNNLNQKPILILIEGLDCSGKKTTARFLQNKLLSNGVSCVINMGPLNSKIYRLISRTVSLHRFPDFIRSFVYAFDGIGESKWYKNFNSQVVIQISSPMRNWAYALMNKKYLRIFILKLIKNNLPKYDYIYFVTTPYENRVKRHASQVKHMENPDEFKRRFPGEDIFNKMESKLIKILNTNNKINNIFNTTDKSYEEIIKEISPEINKHLKKKHELGSSH